MLRGFAPNELTYPFPVEVHGPAGMPACDHYRIAGHGKLDVCHQSSVSPSLAQPNVGMTSRPNAATKDIQ
jgi:hypothetical protein